MLDTERAYFDRSQNHLLSRYPRRFILIKGEEVTAVFEAFDDALQEGVNRFGTDAFLIRRADQNSEEISIPALALGVLHADSPRSV